MESPKKPSFQDLPYEIRLHIFSYLTTVDLCRCVARVCKTWYETLLDTSLWKVLHIKIPLFYRRDRYWEVLKELLPRCALLSHLILDFEAHYLNNRFIEHRRDIKKELEKLTHLQSLTFPNISPEDDMLLLFVKKCTGLKHLTIKDTSKLTKKSWSALASSNIEDIRFNSCHIRYRDDIYILRALPFSVLGLTENQGIFVPSIYITFFSNHRRLLLKFLDLHLAPGFIGRELILAIRENCPNLVALTLSDYVVEDESYIDVLGPLPVTSLRLHKSCFTPNCGSTALIRFFSQPRRNVLRRLILSRFDDFTDHVMLCLSENCPDLRQITLVKCDQVTDRVLAYLLENCKKFKKFCVIKKCLPDELSYISDEMLLSILGGIDVPEF